MSGAWIVRWRDHITVVIDRYETQKWTYVEKDSVAQFRDEHGKIVQIPWGRIMSLTFLPETS